MSISWVLEKERANKRYKQGLRVVMFVLFCFFPHSLSSSSAMSCCESYAKVTIKKQDENTLCDL